MQAINWSLIIKRFGAIVWATAYRLLGNYADAADCFSETFIAAWQVSQKQRIRNLKALLAHLATMRAIDKLRERIRHRKVRTQAEELATVESDNPGPAQQTQQQESAEKLREALNRLPTQEAEVFCLRFLNEMSYRQIGKELGIKSNAVGVILHRTREKLRSFFENE